MIHVILVGTMTKPQVQLPKGAGPEPWCWAGDGRSMDIATYEYVSMLRRSEQPTVQFVFFGVCRLIYMIGHVVCSIIFDVDRPPAQAPIFAARSSQFTAAAFGGSEAQHESSTTTKPPIGFRETSREQNQTSHAKRRK